MTTLVQCPTCGAPVEWKAESTYRPFCSERCKLIDLGAWAAEEHAIPGNDLEDELFSGDLPTRPH
ncbi:DNA gyrase inhibitor YacG [Pseudomonas sp. GOM7]|uniref:DNA gyrase inhibitor YacG n=1 Tax=unclassified Pseudomonas TaxID=196821 RepID=UPI00227C8B17|nr:MULTISPECIES: DNA gyrase inhibitor YacG [unclassified Pseudomonas]WAJ36876.1 DNA gyrase inhibitor YacG [Pseudomonas sp. GOM7]